MYTAQFNISKLWILHADFLINILHQPIGLHKMHWEFRKAGTQFFQYYSAELQASTR
jgi:hypothetical protein